MGDSAPAGNEVIFRRRSAFGIGTVALGSEGGEWRCGLSIYMKLEDTEDTDLH